MQAIKLTKDKYKIWDEFCAVSDDAWFWHTSEWMEYLMEYKLEKEKENLSFMLYQGERLAAVVPLLSEIWTSGGETTKQFSFHGWYIPAPALALNLDRSQRDDILQAAFAEIDGLARKKNVGVAKLGITPLAPSFLNVPHPWNFPMEAGYLNTSLHTLLIDLRDSKEALWKNLRRNHRRSILKGGNFKIKIYDSSNAHRSVFDAYKLMHHKAAGRQTRPDGTFEKMYEWLAAGSAFLAALEMDGKLIGFEYFSVYKNNVYGFSAANDPAYAHLPLRHFLEWEAILWMKGKGFDFYEIGVQWFGPQIYDFPEEKKINISHFKKGFGGMIVPLFMGEKYYDKDHFMKTYKNNIAKIAKNIG